MPDAARRKRIAGTYLAVILCGVLYACFVKATGFGIPCFFHLITGLWCPGCGISRMLLCLLEGDIAGAYRANPFLLITSPFLVFELVYTGWLSWNGKKMPAWNNTLLIIYIVLLILFGICRNL